MNWFMVAVGMMQAFAGVWGFFTGPWRIAVMNLLVASANIVLAGQQ